MVLDLGPDPAFERCRTFVASLFRKRTPDRDAHQVSLRLLYEVKAAYQAAAESDNDRRAMEAAARAAHIHLQFAQLQKAWGRPEKTVQRYEAQAVALFRVSVGRSRRARIDSTTVDDAIQQWIELDPTAFVACDGPRQCLAVARALEASARPEVRQRATELYGFGCSVGAEEACLQLMIGNGRPQPGPRAVSARLPPAEP